MNLKLPTLLINQAFSFTPSCCSNGPAVLDQQSAMQDTHAN